MAGKILVDDRPVEKAGTLISGGAAIGLRDADFPYVSRGGLKLANAIQMLGLSVQGWDCLDVGASTGGFTDCLLQHGARHVFAVDVGYGQLDWTLRQDSRVTVIERTNIRHMSAEIVTVSVDLVTIDVSFISLKIVIPAVLRFMKGGGRILALIKPQFEVGRGKVGKGGVVRDPSVHEAVIEELSFFSVNLGFQRDGLVPSPILGPRGNREFVLSLIRPAPAP